MNCFKAYGKVPTVSAYINEKYSLKIDSYFYRWKFVRGSAKGQSPLIVAVLLQYEIL